MRETGQYLLSWSVMLFGYGLGSRIAPRGGATIMELRHLRYFAAVGDALSFTKAAEALHLAQPSLTRQIQDLETEIGVRLLNRSKRQVSLTPEGRSFLSDAKRVLAHSVDIVESVQRLSRHETGALNIGYVANLFPPPLPVALAAFQRKFPTVSINLFDMTYGDQFRAIKEGKIDLGFVGSKKTIEERGLEFRSIGVDKIVVALRKGNPLQKKAVVKLKDLRTMFFVGMSEESYPGYRDWLTTTCREGRLCSESSSGRGHRADGHSSGRSGAWCGASARASEETSPRKRRLSTFGSGRANTILYRMEK